MRRRCSLMAGLVFMAALGIGCGSTGNNDRLVLQFLRFDNTGLTQQDQVRETSADVDIVQDCCQVAQQQCTKYEPFTNTTVNAIFRNNEGSDISLNQVVIDIGPNHGLGPVTRNITGNIIGGRCNGVQCASDADCAVGGIITPGSCIHTETTIGSILLFDVFEKQHINFGTYNVSITFFGSDPNRSFEVRTSYAVTFADFNNCSTTGG